MKWILADCLLKIAREIIIVVSKEIDEMTYREKHYTVNIYVSNYSGGSLG